MASIAKNFGYNIILNVSRVIMPLITAPYVSRVLEPDGIGLSGFANSYVSYFVLVALLGLPMYGVREVAKCRNNPSELNALISQLVSISMITTLIMSVIYIGTVFYIPQLRVNKLIFIVSGTVLYLVPLQIDWFFQGMERFDFITSRILCIRVISVTLIFLLVKNKDDLIIYVGILALSTILGNLWNFISLKKHGIKFNLSTNKLRRHFKPLMILFSSSVAISIYVILDTIMLGFMCEYNQVGYYTNATHISKTLLTLVTSLSAVAIPRVSSYFKEKNIVGINELMKKSFSIISFLAIPMAIGIICISPQFSVAFFGSAFQGVTIPLAITALLIIAIGFNNLTGVQILIGMGFDKLFLKSVVSGALLNLSLNLVLIPNLGATGAAISSVFAEVLILVITIIYVRKYTQVRIHGGMKDILKSAIGCLPMIPIVIFLSIFTTGWIFIFSAIIIASSAYILIELLLKHQSCLIFQTIIKNKILKKTSE